MRRAWALPGRTSLVTGLLRTSLFPALRRRRSAEPPKGGGMRRITLLFATLAVLAFPATADAAVVVNETDVVIGGTETFTDVNPCTGDRAEITITFNGVFHITELDDGTLHVTFTQAGDFLLDTIKASEPDYTGHFSIWGGFNGNKKNASETFTFEVVGTGTDGSRLQLNGTAQFKVNAKGEVVVDFDKFRCA